MVCVISIKICMYCVSAIGYINICDSSIGLTVSTHAPKIPKSRKHNSVYKCAVDFDLIHRYLFFLLSHTNYYFGCEPKKSVNRDFIDWCALNTVYDVFNVFVRSTNHCRVSIRQLKNRKKQKVK